jgi:hypothetical protein
MGVSENRHQATRLDGADDLGKPGPGPGGLAMVKVAATPGWL